MKKILFMLCLSCAMCAAQAKTHGDGDDQLISCVKEGDAVCVAQALAAGASANAVDKDGVSALSFAAERKSADVVSLLLGAGANVNMKQPGSSLPLCRAALFGRVEIAELLVGAGAKVNVVCDSDHGDTPLLEAMRGAAMAGMPGVLKDDLAATSDGDSGGEESDRAGKVREVLHTSPDSFLAVARLLLARGADVNAVARCESGETALMYAALGADVTTVEMLLARGAQVNNGVSALMMMRGFEAENDKTIRLGLPALSKEQSETRAWLERTKPERDKIVQLLKAAGAKETEDEERDDDQPDAAAFEEAAGEAFTSTILRDDAEDLERLIKAYGGHPLGARVLAEALRIAAIYNRTELVKLLRAWGADAGGRR